MDIQWYEPGASGHAYRPDAPLVDGRVGPAAAGAEPLPVRGRRRRLQAARRLRARQGPEVRHPPDARDPATGGGAEPARQGRLGARRATSPTRPASAPGTPTCTASTWRKPGAQAYYDSVFELVASWGVDFVKVDDISRPYHDNEREIEGDPPRDRPHGPPHGPEPLARRDRAQRGRAREAPREPVADQRRLLGHLAGASGAVRAARALEPPPGTGALARRRHAAAGRARPGPPHDALHARRAAHADDALVDRALAAHPRRRHDEDGRRDARPAHERRGDRRQPARARTTGRCSSATASSPGPRTFPARPTATSRSSTRAIGTLWTCGGRRSRARS